MSKFKDTCILKSFVLRMVDDDDENDDDADDDDNDDDRDKISKKPLS